MDMSSWKQVLIAEFPNLSSEGFETVGDPTERYNCIAYAAGDNKQWWWPNGIDYWPPCATLDNRMESLKEAFACLGYEQYDDSVAEDSYQKVALYGGQGRFEHAALQMPNGAWHSKMGKGPLIEHSNPESLSGGMYGEASDFMRRRTTGAC